MLPVKQAEIKVSSLPEDLGEGLFGQVFLFVFEILPYLRGCNIFPDWDIRAAHYGEPPHHRVIPGVLDLAYQVGPGPKRDVKLSQIHRRHAQVLGNEWQELGDIWHDYFRVPDRLIESANALGSLVDTLGIHYRGNDKFTSAGDTNAVTHFDYLTIIRDFLEQRPELQRIFLATDDYSFYQFLKCNLPLKIINLGEVGFHKSKTQMEGLGAKGDRALLDCVLLSRCRAVLKTSSALSAFAKILNPELEIYRVAASKRFTDVPYFPVAYIPRYTPSTREAHAVVGRLMADDWTQGSDAHRFMVSFAAQARRRNIWRVFESWSC